MALVVTYKVITVFQEEPVIFAGIFEDTEHFYDFVEREGKRSCYASPHFVVTNIQYKADNVVRRTL